MGIFNRLLTAIRGGVSEAGEAMVDAQAIRILEQDIRDAKAANAKARSSLVDVVAERNLAQAETNRLKARLDEYTAHLDKALAQDNEALALEVADKIAELQSDLAGREADYERFNAAGGSLQAQIEESEQTIKQLERELSIVKTTDQVQKAQSASISAIHGGQSAQSKGAEILARKKKAQEKQSARIDASRELASNNADTSLEDKLRQAGIVAGNRASGADILAQRRAALQAGQESHS